MNPSKNVVKKRLGRIAITSVASKQASGLSRPYQIVRRGNEVKKDNSSKSLGSYNADLSFSSSFVNDMDNDLDFMSALDKMETEYGQKSVENKQVTEKDYCSKVPGTRNSKLDASRIQPKGGNSTDCKIKSTPKRAGKENVTNGNEDNQPSSDSFHDLSFASPMDISTPQLFKAKKLSESKSKRLSVPRKSKSSIVETEKKKSSKFKTSTPQVTPCRARNSGSSGRKGRSQLKKKRVLDGLEDVSLEENTNKSKTNNEFFKSLMIDNVSLDESYLKNDKGKNTGNVESLKNSKQKSVISQDKAKDVKTVSNLDDCDINIGNQKAVAVVGNEEIINSHSGRIEDNEISMEDLPKFPTRETSITTVGSNTSHSVSAVGKTLEIKPDLQADQLALSSWGLPDPVLKQYHARGVTHMFQWQAECLLTGNVLGGGNLVYSAPTSAGKTMVAELLVLKRVIETRKKAIIILPFVSVTREKMFYLQDLYQDAGIRVSGFMGHYAPAGGFSSVDVAVCTIEKGNSLINRMLEENKLDQLGIIVIDELHLIGDRHRGYLLELLLTKISYMSLKSKSNASSDTSSNIQIVGMSATLPNLDLLAQWLNADLYRTDFRPVPLSECIKIGTAIYDSDLKLVRDIDVKYAVKGDEDHVVPLCIETIRNGHSILIFCPTKNWCEKLAETVAREFYNLLRNPEVAVAGKVEESSGFVKASDLLVLPLDQAALRDVVEQLRRTPVGIDSVLGRTVQFGSAYHHAGLTFDERDIIEGAFRQGILKMLVATSTLSSGVNLPARRVLVRTPVFHGQLIDFLTYKQMIGRAGRKGVDTAGESILLCKPNERAKAEKLVRGALPAVQSTLIRNEGEPLSSSLKRAILEVVVSGVAMSPAEVACYASCTLLAASMTKEQDQTTDLIKECIDFLQDNEFVCTQKIKENDGIETERFVPTQLGAAVLASSISPDEGLVVFSELQRARQCFVLENELHIIYQVTPIYAQIDSIDWYQYFSIWESLTIGMRKVAELVGIQESFLAKAIRGRILTKTSAQLKLLAIHKRFYTALVLHDLVQETPLNEVCMKYNCNKGQLQSLQQSAATFAGMVTVFCARLGWSNLELILSQFQNRLTFGVQRELCDLVRISALNGQRARVMYNGGYQTVAALASAHPADIEALLKNSAPFQSNKKQDTESEWEAAERRKTRCIFLTGRKGVTEYDAAVAIITEAKSFIQEELGGLGIQWVEGNKEPHPSLKSPVLLSPLAASSRSKKRRSGSKAKTNSRTTNNTKEETKTENVRSKCVLSPKTSVPENGKELNVDMNERAKIRGTPESVKVSFTVTLTKNENTGIDSESKLKEIKGKVVQGSMSGELDLRSDKSDGTDTKGEILTRNECTVSDTGSNRTIDRNQTNLVKNLITTTAVIEKMPISVTDNEIESDNIDAKKVSKDKSELESKFNDETGLIGIVGKNEIKNGTSSSEGKVDKIIETTSVKKDKNVTFTNERAVEINTPNIEQARRKRKTNDVDNTDVVDKEVIKNAQNDEKESLEICQILDKEKSNTLMLVEKSIQLNSNLGQNGYLESNKTLNRNFPSKNSILSERSSGFSEIKSSTEDGGNINENKQLQFNSSIQSNHGNSKIANDSDFGESLIIDTQSLDSLEKGSSSKDMLSENAVNSTNVPENNGVNNAVNDIYSEGLFSEDTGIDSVSPANQIILDSTNSPTLSTGSKLPESDVNVVVKDGVDIHERSTRSSHSESDTDLSHNALDMNISQFSGEDMFNQSADLVAASNYERVASTEDSRVETDDINASYQDLHIPYQSGQEKCFDKADKDAPFIANVVTNLHGRNISNVAVSKNNSYKPTDSSPAFGQQLNVLGQFSSQKQGKAVSACQEKLHEDLAIALAMGESFSSTFNEPTQTSAKVINIKRDEKVNQSVDDQLGDSLTVSMVDNVFSDAPNSLPWKRTSNSYGERTGNAKENTDSEKQICDINLQTKTMKSNEIIIHNSSLTVIDGQVTTKSSSSEEFRTPKHGAVRNKRLRESPVVRNTKIQKITEDGYSTPEALEKHVKRTGGLELTGPNIESPTPMNIRETRKRKGSTQKDQSSGKSRRSSTEMSRRGSAGVLNSSTGSDCVPPTPPDEAPTGSGLGALRTPCRSSPLVSTLPTPPFSPKINRYNRDRKSQLKATPLKDIVKNQTKDTVVRTDTNNCNSTTSKRKNTCRNEVNTLKTDNSRISKVTTDMDNDSIKQDGTGKFNSKTVSGLEALAKGSNSGVVTGTKYTGNDKDENYTGNDSSGQTVKAENGIGEDNTNENCTDKDGVDDIEADEDFLSPSFIDPDESGIPMTQSSFTIIDVCGDKRLFKTFIMEWRTKTRYSVALACEKMVADCQGGGIGANFKPGDIVQRSSKDSGISVDSLGIRIVGLAVSWENRDAYYVTFTHEQHQEGDPDDSLAPPPSDTDISIAIRIKAVKSVLQQAVCKDQPVTMVMFDVKSHYRALAEGCGFAPKGQFEDPKIACWMLDPGAKEKNLHRMVTNLLPTEVHMLHGIGGGIGVSSLGMSPQNPGSGRYRATTEAVLVRHLGEYFRACLEKEEIYTVFKDVEMPSAVTLCRMELNGFGFSQEESENQKTVMSAKLSALEEQAYMLAGHPFSLSATEDVAQVLFYELQLPPNGDPASVPALKSLAPKRGPASRRQKGKAQYSTSKDILEKLKKLHPLPGVILEWRRITNALTKTVFPLQKEKVCCDWLSMYRIYGDCQLHTATGRVSMTEPNLQNVPKDFDILLPDLIGESPPANMAVPISRRTRAGNSRIQKMIGQRQVAKVTDENTGSQFCVSMRHAFIPFKGGVLLAADYSQLELRMISYLSNDLKLISILNKDGDVFKLITAQWKNIKPEEVTPEQRAQAKQVCYGMIYGIGPKALGEQLDVEENDAACFIETFKAKYPGMRAYLRHTVENCRVNGYVQTMLGRKRYLQTITSTNPHARAQAERQAVNTTVQGSAADLVKMATIKIDERLTEMFPNTQYTHKHKLTSKHPSRVKTPPDGAYLVLQLHDELIYEVSETHVHTVAQLVKHCMETAMELPVKMPVKVKVGPSWGKLQDYEI